MKNQTNSTLKTQIFNWRKSYEPFRGIVYEFGNYTIQEEKNAFTAYHAGEKIYTSCFFMECDMACSRHANTPTGWYQV